MDQSQRIILTPFNLFKWKVEMQILLRGKGIYRVTMETEVEPNAVAEVNTQQILTLKRSFPQPAMSLQCSTQ